MKRRVAVVKTNTGSKSTYFANFDVSITVVFFKSDFAV